METLVGAATRVRVGAWFIVIMTTACPALADPINLMWDPSGDPVSGYFVHVGPQSGTYTQRYDAGAMTSFVFPNAVAGQRYCFAVSAYDGGGESSLSPEVCGYSDAPPVLVNPGSQTAVAGTPVALQLAGSDPYGQAVSYSATGLPPGLMLAPGTGFISGAGSTTGTYAVTARVSDGRLSASQAFSWTMSARPVSAPSIAITSPTSAAGFATTGSLITLKGIAAAGAGVAEVRWSNGRGGGGMATGTTSWMATSIPLQSGVNTITVLARDGAGNEAADVLDVTYTLPASPVTLTARGYVQKGKKYVALTWTGCPWAFVDIIRDGLPLTTTQNDGAYTDNMKKGATYTYRLCETGNRGNCSNTVSVTF